MQDARKTSLFETMPIPRAVLALSVPGYANMLMAVFADVGVSVIAILNASRMLRAK